MPHLADSLACTTSLTDPVSRIRRLEAADESFVRELFQGERAAQFAPLGLSDAMLGALLDQQYHAQRAAYAHRFPDAGHFIIEHAGAGVGRLIVTFADAPEVPEAHARSPGHVLHLVDIVLAAAWRNRGIGSDVIDSLARAGEAVGAVCFTLLVLQTNHAARRLYERLGFRALAEGVYVFMERKLP